MVFNFEVKNSYTICVRTTGNGSPNLSFDEQFTITINDTDDAPVAAHPTAGSSLRRRGAVGAEE